MFKNIATQSQNFVNLFNHGNSMLHNDTLPPQPFNPVSNNAYAGFNDFMLSMDARTMNDPRWLTQSQAIKAGYSINENAEPVQVEYWRIFDKNGNKLAKPTLILGHVFNGQDIIGLDAYIQSPPAWQTTPIPSLQEILKFDNDHVQKSIAGTELAKEQNFRAILAQFSMARVFKQPFTMPKLTQLPFAIKKNPLILRKFYNFGKLIAKAMLYTDKHWQNAVLAWEQPTNYKDKDQVMEDKIAMVSPWKIYINVPFEHRREARSLGANFDSARNSYFLTNQNDNHDIALSRFAQHYPKTANEITELALEEFREFAKTKGLDINELHDNGQWHRVAIAGDKGSEKSGAYLLHSGGRVNGLITNFKLGIINAKFIATGQSKPAHERQIINPNYAELQAKQSQNRQIIHDKVAKQAFAIIANPKNTFAHNHEYLTAKAITHNHGLKVQPPYQDKHGNMIDNKNLLIPIVNLDGIVRSVQFIKPNGTKIFLKDGEKHGNFTIIDDKNTKTALKYRDYPQIIIAEGIATAISLYEATKIPVVVAFDSGNLAPVAQNIRAQFPTAHIIIAADNDHKREVNVGIACATKASQLINAEVRTPNFGKSELIQGLTDYNDYAKSRGIPALAQEFNGNFYEKKSEIVLK